MALVNFLKLVKCFCFFSATHYKLKILQVIVVKLRHNKGLQNNFFWKKKKEIFPKLASNL